MGNASGYWKSLNSKAPSSGGSSRSVLSSEEWAEVASTLVTVAERQQQVCEDLLDRLGTALNALDRGTAELTRDTPDRIAHKAAQEVVERVGVSVNRSVADVLRPAEASARGLVHVMEEAASNYNHAAATYRQAARNAVVTSTLYACASSAGAAMLVILVMKAVGIF